VNKFSIGSKMKKIKEYSLFILDLIFRFIITMIVGIGFLMLIIPAYIMYVLGFGERD